MTAFHARKALLPGGWTDNVRLTVDAGRIVGIHPGEIPADGKWCVVDAVHVDRDRAREEFAETLKLPGASS